MAEAAVESRRNVLRFYCHRCNVEFEHLVQDFTCPYCATGFIERVESDRDGDSFVSGLEDEEYSDADMSNLEDTSNHDNSHEENLDNLTRTPGQSQPMLNDLAFLMTGGRVRPVGGRRAESRSLMEQLVLMINGGRGAPGAVTAGAPFVLVGAPGDYVFGGEGLDAVVTQLLGQLENTGPPPLPTQQIQAIPTEKVTAEQVEANMSCSVCWDNFKLDEVVSRLECSHMFHGPCITPWLQLHATCPICRRSLLTAEQQAQGAFAPLAELIISPASSSAAPTTTTTTTTTQGMGTPAYSRVVVRRLGPRRRVVTTGSPSESSSGSGGAERRFGPGLWSFLTSQLASAEQAGPPSTAPPSTAPPTSAPPSATPSASTLSSTDRDAMYMDIDYD